MTDQQPWPHVGLFIDSTIASDTTLTLAERFVLAYVIGFERQHKRCFASAAHMAATLGLSENYVKNVRAELVEKGRLLRIPEGRKVYFAVPTEILSDQPQPTEIPSATDRNSVASRQKICRLPTEILSHINIDYKKAISEDIRENTPLPPNPPQEGSKEWFDYQADKYLAVPTGNEAWERDSQFVSGGRRPMTKFPSLWFTRSELASAIEVVRDALPDDDIKPVFRLAEAEAMTKQIDRGGRKIPAYKYVTGHCLQNHLETLTKTTRLAKTRSK